MVACEHTRSASSFGQVVASPVDASTRVPPLTIYERAGSPRPSAIQPHGPGLLLMGGGATVDPAFVWMHDTIAGAHGVRGGDIIVLTASEGDDYTPYLMAVAPFNSVRSISLGPGATQADLTRAASFVDHAQGVFFSGGDQAHYVRWKGSPLIAAVQQLYHRGGVVGGTSAGLAILGEYVYDSVAADARGDDVEVRTPNAMADPSEPIISFTHGLFDFPPLRGVITDTHLVTRDRLGRLVVFLARLQATTGKSLLGVGVNEGSAIVIDRNGIGTLMLEHQRGEALLVRLTQRTPIVAGKPFTARGIRITVLNRDGQRVDFNSKCAQAPTYLVNLDGSKAPYYDPMNPYVAPRRATIPKCGGP
jgi:cyanophycinase